MKPMRLIPAYKDYLWGGRKLTEIYGKSSGLSRTAESWELSVHPDGLSVIADGKFARTTLADYIAKDPSVLGTNRSCDELPILVKLIDAADDLSIQVHPDDEKAKVWEGQNGKTEMWYVMDCEPGAKIVYGLKDDVNRETFAQSIRDNSVMDLLNREDSAPGSVFFVDAGTVHAIGKGNLIAEIQQNSNVTYRLYDYDRRDKDGNPRELHIEKGVLSASLKKSVCREIPVCSDGSRLLGSCPFFQVRERKIRGTQTLFVAEESYLCLLSVGGSLTVCGEAVAAGETLFFPAGSGDVIVEGEGTLLQITNPPRYFVGIDLGGTNIAAAVVDECGIIYGRSSRKTLAPRPYTEIFDDMAACVWDAVFASGLARDDVESVGIGCPGALNKAAGTVEFSNNLDFYDVPIVSYMEKALGKKVYIENDANAAAWGEFLAGSGADVSDMIMITLGTGVGSGIIINGRLFTGAWGKGAELGHMVIRQDGEDCTCGRKGCLEAYASATALIRLTKKEMESHPDSELWRIAGSLDGVTGKTAFDGTDEVSHGIIDRYTNDLADGIVNIVNIFQPEMITLGGGVSKSGERILQPLRKAVKKYSFARFGKEEPNITCATLGNDAGIIGAALLWKNED